MSLWSRLKSLLREETGVSAIEFAFIAPLLVAVAVGTTEAGLVTYHYYDMEAAVSSGAQYILRGGTDSAALQAVVQSGWTTRTGGASVNVVQFCRCAKTITQCTAVCPDLTSPHGYTTVSAADTYHGLFMTTSLSASETIRVR